MWSYKYVLYTYRSKCMVDNKNWNFLELLHYCHLIHWRSINLTFQNLSYMMNHYSIPTIYYLLLSGNIALQYTCCEGRRRMISGMVIKWGSLLLAGWLLYEYTRPIIPSAARIRIVLAAAGDHHFVFHSAIRFWHETLPFILIWSSSGNRESRGMNLMYNGDYFAEFPCLI
jgi:hypothetical protein